MNPKQVAALLLLLIAVGLHGRLKYDEYGVAPDSTYYESDQDFYFSLNYTHDLQTVSRYQISLESILTKNLYYEIPLTGITHIADDVHNDNKSNFSLIPTVGFVLLAFTHELLAEELHWVDFEDMEIVTLLLNSNLYYPILTYRGKFMPPHQRQYFMRSRVNLSVYCKLENDWFIFRRNQWAQIAPGAGLRVEYGSRFAALYLQSGYENAFQFASNSKPQSQLNPVFKAGFVCNIALPFLLASKGRH